MKSFLATIILIISLIGCRTVDTVTKTDKVTDSVARHNVDATRVITDSSTAVLQSTDRTEKADTAVTESVVERYSIPDSMGMQYVTERVYVHERTGSISRNDIKLGFVQTYTRRDSINMSDSSSVDLSKKESTDTSIKKKPPAWRFWIWIIFALAIVLFAFLILRRFKLL